MTTTGWGQVRLVKRLRRQLFEVLTRVQFQVDASWQISFNIFLPNEVSFGSQLLEAGSIGRAHLFATNPLKPNRNRTSFCSEWFQGIRSKKRWLSLFNKTIRSKKMCFSYSTGFKRFGTKIARDSEQKDTSVSKRTSTAGRSANQDLNSRLQLSMGTSYPLRQATRISCCFYHLRQKTWFIYRGKMIEIPHRTHRLAKTFHKRRDFSPGLCVRNLRK